jgi:hypothetical protein
MSMPSLSSRLAAWKCLICGLLLLATTINYMDRQTLASASVRRRVGRLTGLLSAWVWAVTSPMHKCFGKLADSIGSF